LPLLRVSSRSARTSAGTPRTPGASLPGGSLIYAILGLVIFAGFTMFDFQRLRRSKDIATAPLLAASIFLDILNVFLFFLQIFGRRS